MNYIYHFKKNIQLILLYIFSKNIIKVDFSFNYLGKFSERSETRYLVVICYIY